MWTGKKPNLSHVKVFGCQAYAQVPSSERKKLDVKSREWISVGYSQNPTTYRLRDSSNPKKLIESRDVVFIEDKFHTNNTNKSTEEIISLDQLTPASSDAIYAQEELNSEDEQNDSYYSIEDETLEEQPVQSQNSSDNQRRYLERIRKRKEFPDYVSYKVMCDVNQEPQSVKEAMESADRDKWKLAMKQEYQSLKDNKT